MTLEDRLIGVLKRAKKPLPLSEIEFRLDPRRRVDTFDVRDCVWKLIREGKADFTPGRLVFYKRGTK